MASPLLKQLSQLTRRVFSPWRGHHIVQSDLSTSTVIPWGFVSQQKVLERVTPERVVGGGGSDGEKVEKRAEHLNLDTGEFLRGAEEAYRCAARLFAQQQEEPQAASHYGTPAAAPAQGQAVRGPTSEGSMDSCSGRGGSGGVSSIGQEAREGGSSERLRMGRMEGQEPAGRRETDFFDFDVASPQLSMFLNDVLESYRVQGLVPRLSVTSVEAKLCKVGVRLGGISKNTNFMGAMSADEAKYHLTMGMLGPEGVVIDELEGRAPRRVIADVELTCQEEFLLEDGEGRVVYMPESCPRKVHYLTLQSNIGEATDLEWQITNINDVIKPTFSYYFSRFGH
eukprot:g11350.t1